MSAYEWISVVIQTFTLIAIGIYTYFARKQWNAMDKNVMLTKQSMTEANRAWLLAVGGETSKGLAVNETAKIRVILQNQGLTPAFAVYSRCNWTIRPPGPVPETEFQAMGHVQGGSLSVIGSRGESRLQVEVTLTPELWEELRSERKRLSVFGEVTYTDTFKAHRLTRFCFVHVRGDWLFCDTNNFAN